MLDLEYLLDTFPEDAFTAKYKQLNTAMTGLVSDYRCFIVFNVMTQTLSTRVLLTMTLIRICKMIPSSLVNFLPVTVKSKERMLVASQTIDKANGGEDHY